MPDLAEELCNRLEIILNDFIKYKKGYKNTKYITAGGSAAVFRVETPVGYRAIKVFNPEVISDVKNSADEKRLLIQKNLIDHDCEYLIKTFNVEKFGGTAFIEMEYVDWPSLKNYLEIIPDEKISILILQLVAAVKYLEERGIVHRDIKPENIHVSPDFSSLKLLDLGVVREFEDNDDYLSTDTGGKKLFLATAQYSSPEYLFRLSDPTPELWKGLNYYQVGAVLHDLIEKKPLFHEEVATENRWLLARAVLTKVPNFSVSKNIHLAKLKSIAIKCLTKDLSVRLSIVSWDMFEPDFDAMLGLMARLSKGANNNFYEKKIILNKHEKCNFCRNFFGTIRDAILLQINKDIIIKLSSGFDSSDFIKFYFDIKRSGFVGCVLRFEWGDGIYNEFAKIYFSSYLTSDADKIFDYCFNELLVCEVKLKESEEESSKIICDEIANSLVKALDLIDASSEGDVLSFDLLEDHVGE